MKLPGITRPNPGKPILDEAKRKEMERIKKEATSNTRIKVVGNYFLFKRPGRNPVKVKDQKQARLDIKNKRRAVHGLPAKLSYRDI